MSRLKLHRSLSVTITALLASSFAQAQTATFTEHPLDAPGTSIIQSVSSGGTVLGYYTSPTGGTATAYTYFETPALGGALTILSTATSQDGVTFNGYSPVGPLGAASADGYNQMPQYFRVNNAGQVLGFTSDIVSGNVETAVTSGPGGTSTIYGSPFCNAGPCDLIWLLSNDGTLAGFTGNGAISYYPPGSSTAAHSISEVVNPPPNILLYGTAAISSDTDRVGGTAFVSGPNGTEHLGFFTGPNVGAVSLVSAGPNSSVNVQFVNNAGQIGGYVQLLDSPGAQYLAFITDPITGALEGIGPGDPGDASEVTFLNNAGEEIVEDLSNSQYYLYASGEIYNLDTLLGLDPTLDYTPVGLTDDGSIVMSNLITYSITTLPADGVLNANTLAYQEVAANEAAVPAPRSLGLMTLGAFLLTALRRKTSKLET